MCRSYRRILFSLVSGASSIECGYTTTDLLCMHNIDQNLCNQQQPPKVPVSSE